MDLLNDADPVANENEKDRCWAELRAEHNANKALGRATGKLKVPYHAEWTAEELQAHAERTNRDFISLMEFATRRYDPVVWCYCDSLLVYTDLREAHRYLCNRRKSVI